MQDESVEKPSSSDSIGSKISYLLSLVIISALVIGGCAMIWIGSKKVLDDFVSDKAYTKISKAMEEDLQEIAVDSKEEEYTPPDELLLLMEENSDVVGYLVIDDTKISYPITQAPEDEDNDYYLHLNIKKTYSYAGTIFLDKNQDIIEGCLHSIYGHNMKNGTMFGSLFEYDDQDYMEKHRAGAIYTKTEKIDLEVVDFVEVPEDTYMMTNVSSEARAAAILEQVMYRDFDPANYYVLTTCMYQKDNNRGFLVMKRTN